MSVVFGLMKMLFWVPKLKKVTCHFLKGNKTFFFKCENLANVISYVFSVLQDCGTKTLFAKLNFSHVTVKEKLQKNSFMNESVKSRR